MFENAVSQRVLPRGESRSGFRFPERGRFRRRSLPGGDPEELLVVGGGYIGLELGTFFSSLGTEVTVVEMLPGLVQGLTGTLRRCLKSGSIRNSAP